MNNVEEDLQNLVNRNAKIEGEVQRLQEREQIAERVRLSKFIIWSLF